MRKPTIHTNGTGAAGLFEQLANTTSQLRQTLRVLEASAPHGRDYYPQGDDAITEAIAEHVSRLDRVRSVLVECEELIQHVADHRK